MSEDCKCLRAVVTGALKSYRDAVARLDQNNAVEAHIFARIGLRLMQKTYEMGRASATKRDIIYDEMALFTGTPELDSFEALSAHRQNLKGAGGSAEQETHNLLAEFDVLYIMILGLQ